MFDLPDGALSDVSLLADWVETCALFGRNGVMSRSEVRGAILASLESDDEADALVEDAWGALQRRADQQGVGFPLIDDGVGWTRRSSWHDWPAYSLLLLADVGRFYAGVAVDFVPGGPFPVLFELAVQAAQHGLFGGRSIRFGAPALEPSPKRAVDRLRWLATELGLKTLQTEAAVRALDQDLGLDIVTRIQIGDEEPGTAFVLTQCATGENWDGKKGEPALEHWAKLLDWSAMQFRALAVPWRLGSEGERRGELFFRAFDFDAVILDRPRLSAGAPDRYLDDAHRLAMGIWCQSRIDELPPLTALP